MTLNVFVSARSFEVPQIWRSKLINRSTSICYLFNIAIHDTLQSIYTIGKIWNKYKISNISLDILLKLSCLTLFLKANMNPFQSGNFWLNINTGFPCSLLRQLVVTFRTKYPMYTNCAYLCRHFLWVYVTVSLLDLPYPHQISVSIFSFFHFFRVVAKFFFKYLPVFAHL